MKRYFIISQDRSLQDMILLRDFNICGQRHLFHKEDAERINHTTVLYLASDTGEEAPDFIQSPVQMVSLMMKSVLDMYEDELIFKKVALINKEKKSEMVYYQVLMDEIEGLSNTVERYPNNTEKKIVLDNKKIGAHKVFMLADSRMKDPIVSLEVVESMLRRHVTGVLFQEVEVVEHGC